VATSYKPAGTPRSAGCTAEPNRKKAERSERTTHATLEHTGQPHRGKVTPEEARLVREHLAEINQRMAAEGLRKIDSTNPNRRREVWRHGADTTARQLMRVASGPSDGVLLVDARQTGGAPAGRVATAQGRAAVRA